MIWTVILYLAQFLLVFCCWYVVFRRSRKLEARCLRLNSLVLESNKINQEASRLIFEYMVNNKALSEMLGRLCAIADIDPRALLKELDNVRDRVKGEETIKQGFVAPDQAVQPE